MGHLATDRTSVDVNVRISYVDLVEGALRSIHFVATLTYYDQELVVGNVDQLHLQQY